MPRKIKDQKSKIKNKEVAAKVNLPNPNAIPGGKLNNFLNNISGKLINFKRSKTPYIIVLILGLLLLAVYKKSWFIAAVVNGTPITNLELQMRLNEQYRSQTLTQLINEKIILNEAATNNVAVSQADINKKIAEIETSVGGADSLNAILTQQGQTRNSIRQQIKLQLVIEKLYAKEATVSAEEVAKFIEQNKDQLKATSSADQEKEATDDIKNQKLSQIFSQKFQDLKNKAKVQIF